MKKVFLVLALVAAYGVSIAMNTVEANSANFEQITVVADVDEVNSDAPEKEKAETKEATTAKSTTAAKGEGCGTAKSEGCASEKSSGCSGKAKAESTDKKDDSK